MNDFTNNPPDVDITDIELPSIVATWVISGLELCLIARPGESARAREDARNAMDDIVACAQKAIAVPVEGRNDTIRMFHQLATYLPSALASRGFVEIEDLIRHHPDDNKGTLCFWLPTYNLD